MRISALLVFALALILPAAACADQGPFADSPSGERGILSVSRDPVEDTAQRYLNAFVDGDYGEMWSLLTDEARSRWPDQQAYTDFLARKYGGGSRSYTTGTRDEAADGLSASLPVSLAAGEPQAAYGGPPLRLERRDGSWLVAEAGPLGPQGSIAGAPTPLQSELGVPVLTYHHVAPQEPADRQRILDTVTVDAFAAQLDWLAASGYRSITLSELFNAFYYGLPLPAKPIILVFDDGYADVYVHAFPLLRQRGMGATVAMISGAIDAPEYLTWAQIREMAAAGVEFSSHSATHPSLASLTPQAARAELADSKRTLEEGLGRPVQFFVYPYGEPFTSGSPDSQRTIMDLLAQEGYLGALKTSSGPPYISLQKAGAPYELNRIPVSGRESLRRFIASVGGTP